MNMNHDSYSDDHIRGILNSVKTVAMVGAPAGCAVAVQLPSDGAPKAQTMNEDTFMSGENSNFGAMFANKITVSCP